MSISAMKQALEALDCIYSPLHVREINKVGEAMSALRQAIAEAEKQEPVAIGDEWKPCVKLPIIVHVREQRKGETHVSTREGITPVRKDDLIMRGVAGEEYPIGRELFNRTYTFETAPVHAIDISQERVDETAKREHEPFVWLEDDKGNKYKMPEDNKGPLLKRAEKAFEPPKREWVRLTDEEIFRLSERIECCKYSICAAEEKLKEKNT